VVSALVGVSRVSQLEDNVGAVKNLDFSEEEIKQIDKYANEGDINIWSTSSNYG
jgi:L-glyceraldehyde 3-phosphate reductase